MSAKERAEREDVRLTAGRMFEDGVRPSVIARALRVSTKSTYSWRRQWRAGGRQALLSKGPGGERCRLSDEQLGWLQADLQAGPGGFGWVDDQRWTAARVADLVAAGYGVRYTDRGMAYLLHRIGFTPQVPVRRAAERDERAVQRWRDEVWPRVNRPRPTEAPGSSLRTKPAKG